MLTRSSNWAAGNPHSLPLHNHLEPSTIIRKRSANGKQRNGNNRAVLRVSNSDSSKKANLSAARKERVKLDPNGGGYQIGDFLSRSSGIQAILNTKALQSVESLDANIYRCILPKIKLLNFEAAPVLDLRVIPTDDDCTIEMLSCKVQFFCLFFSFGGK
ncbi:hypothetical protein LINGRAHAP2_LOCUS24766 [Linum grandiflorum]